MDDEDWLTFQLELYGDISWSSISGRKFGEEGAFYYFYYSARSVWIYVKFLDTFFGKMILAVFKFIPISFWY